MRRLLTGSLAFAAVFSAATASRAHIDLLDPPPRHTGNDSQKTGPCGVANDARSATLVTEYVAGSNITVKWDETIDHNGHYRILFAQDGFQFPPASAATFCSTGDEVTPGVYCLADGIQDQAGAPEYQMNVTLPDMPCDNCTLQLIQWMDDAAAGQETYYECADLILTPAGAGGAGGATSSATGTGVGGGMTSGTGAGVGGAGGDDNSFNPYPDDSKGCSMGQGQGQGSTAAAAAAALGLLALFSRRRRSAR
ncbi:SCE4755 family polysaccharide monooxygenase-like protein [Chondromyces apiculatus]|uniref:Chitin-binding type-4 domain-containing protein n=1 Tax=Chondromyces apiculatus DSM 436 TaxID=1192034 RepID=A0A017TDT9_9BACT|nr:SCE4755 family polysaccharide monooxygenase-like protein [Chondromyces apiculatus]EYF06975.1 Hypothetical protein CAP_1234 [Chondromyces apiculatus DSM 436]